MGWVVSNKYLLLFLTVHLIQALALMFHADLLFTELETKKPNLRVFQNELGNLGRKKKVSKMSQGNEETLWKK